MSTAAPEADISRKPQTRMVVRSSAIAKMLSPPHLADENGLKFGKVFEEVYTEFAWRTQDPENEMGILIDWGEMATETMLKEGIYSEANAAKMEAMRDALLLANADGEKPATEFKPITGNIVLAAQPDLYNIETGEYIEFKTVPIDDYAITQAKVFSYALGEPIRLIGLRDIGDGNYEAEEQTVTADGFALPAIPRELLREQEWCTVCNKPASDRRCAKHQRASLDDIEDDDFEP